MKLLRLSLVLIAFLVGSLSFADEEESNSQGVRFFETKVRPVLVQHCYKCHGAKKQESSLRLDSLAAIQRGGESGPTIVSGEPDQSLLITAIGYENEELQMPPEKKLSDRQIKDLRHWVTIGAPYPKSNKNLPPDIATTDIERGRDFWSFQPPVDPPVPTVKDKNWSPLDRFILSALESKGLGPAHAADKRTLIRRATFDLIGLPPTPAEIDAFLADDSPDAFKTVVNRLLDSPQYGVRWGRHWLDVARYADSNGLDENVAHGNAWRYRNYVIASFNKDKPYDQFLLEQIAGDLLPTVDMAEKHERLIATGFLSLGPKVLAEVDERKMEMDIVDEQIDTVGRAFMGLTFGCARCHNHKFDPIRTTDYYALAGIFKSTRTMEHFKKIARWWENPIATEEDLKRKASHEKKVAQQKSVIQNIVDKATEQLKANTEPGVALSKNPESRFSGKTKAELKQLRDALAKLEASAPEMPTAMGVTDGEVADVAVHVRGSHLTFGALVRRRFPMVFAGENQLPFEKTRSGRLRLAQWLVSADHPLTSRVMVNRIWRWHFGAGLVATTDNFGQLGERPVNQPLLDWLAIRFSKSGWSIKQMHRLMMLSATYQMGSQHNERAAAVDPENRLLWRANVRRLEAEAIRDALLAVSGTLDTSMGRSMLHVENRKFIFDHTSKDETQYDTRRRSIYLPVVRNNLYDVFSLFDYSDASMINGNRPTSTVAPQALFMMNSTLVSDAAWDLAKDLLAAQNENVEGRVNRLYLRAFGRSATNQETARASRFLQVYQNTQAKQDSEANDVRLAAWQALCHTIVASSEFIYIR